MLLQITIISRNLPRFHVQQHVRISNKWPHTAEAEAAAVAAIRAVVVVAAGQSNWHNWYPVS